MLEPTVYSLPLAFPPASLLSYPVLPSLTIPFLHTPCQQSPALASVTVALTIPFLHTPCQQVFCVLVCELRFRVPYHLSYQLFLLYHTISLRYPNIIHTRHATPCVAIGYKMASFGNLTRNTSLLGLSWSVWNGQPLTRASRVPSSFERSWRPGPHGSC